MVMRWGKAASDFGWLQLHRLLFLWVKVVVMDGVGSLLF
jgi:hypothetical protein